MGTAASTSPHRLVLYARLIRLDKPIGIYLLLWPAMWALVLASRGMPDLAILSVFVAGVVLMRSAGCAINDYADREIDPHVARTRDRPLASGALHPREALVVTAVLAALALGLTVLILNPLTIALALGAGLLAATYPFMKRLHSWPQAHLGVAFAWSVPMAFTAITDTWPPPLAWLLFAAVVVWTVAYDTLYAMVDREDDLKLGVKSTAILFASADRLVVGLLQGLVIVMLTGVGLLGGLGPGYYVALGIGAVLFVYQQVLIRGRDPGRCLRAFLNNQYFGLVVFLGIASHYGLSLG